MSSATGFFDIPGVCAATPPGGRPAPAPAQELGRVWPASRDVARESDMERAGFLRVGLDMDNDVFLEIHDGKDTASVEFCVPGAGGGRSPRTRMALVALMVAIEADNAESPSLDWWAARAGTMATVPVEPRPTHHAYHDGARAVDGTVDEGASFAASGASEGPHGVELSPADEAVLLEIATHSVLWYGDHISMALNAARHAWKRARIMASRPSDRRAGLGPVLGLEGDNGK
jgi:hypothetical protein